MQKVHTLHPGFSWHARQHAPADDVRNVPPLRTSPSSSAFSSALHGVTGPTSAVKDISGPAPQYGIAGAPIGMELASDPSRTRHDAITLSGPPTRKQPGHSFSAPSTKLTRRPSDVIVTTTSSHVSIGCSSPCIGELHPPGPQPLRNVGAGSASWTPAHVVSNDAGSTV